MKLYMLLLNAGICHTAAFTYSDNCVDLFSYRVFGGIRNIEHHELEMNVRLQDRELPSIEQCSCTGTVHMAPAWNERRTNICEAQIGLLYAENTVFDACTLF